MRLKPWLPAVLVLAALTYLALRPAPLVPPGDARLLQRDFLALGTLVSISVHLDDGTTRQQAEQALGAAQWWLRAFEQRWAAWGSGELAAINRELAAGRAAIVPEELASLFALAEAQRRRSRGLFDARIGELVRLWGFDQELPRQPALPSKGAIAEAVRALAAAPDWTAEAAYGPAPGIAWDFGAIAKGYAVDQLVAQLRAAGLDNVIVNAGGNLRATGRHGDRPWRIGIRHPRGTSSTEALAVLETLGDEAVVTSGDYERYFEHEGRRYHHILNPRSGAPAQGLQAVTVVLPDAARADAASTALFVAGPDGWRDASILLDVSQLLIVDAQGRVTVTRPLARRLEFAEGINYRVVE